MCAGAYRYKSSQYTVTGRAIAELNGDVDTNTTTNGRRSAVPSQRAAQPAAGARPADPSPAAPSEPSEPSAAVVLPRPRAATSAVGQLAAALEYVEDRHWEVVLGTSVRRGPDGWSCSCADPQCRMLGAHPAERDWQKRISGQPSRAREWWEAQPDASILLPTGRAFDVLEVSRAAGCAALARLERTGASIGPVAETPDGRMQFYVLPNARTKAVKLLAAQGWARARLDLVVHGPGGCVVAAPSFCGIRGRVLWARPPGEANRWLPDVEELVAPIAYACGQDRRAPAAG